MWLRNDILSLTKLDICIFNWTWCTYLLIMSTFSYMDNVHRNILWNSLFATYRLVSIFSISLAIDSFISANTPLKRSCRQSRCYNFVDNSTLNSSLAKTQRSLYIRFGKRLLWYWFIYKQVEIKTDQAIPAGS